MIQTNEKAHGLYPGLSYEEYDADRGIRATRLKGFAKSDQHARWAETHPKESGALVLGNAVHTYVLERSAFYARYFIAPKCDKRTNVGKAAWTDAMDEAGARIVIGESDLDQIKGMADSILMNDDARAILFESEGLNEVTAFWESPPGLGGEVRRCKARVDRLCSWNGVPTVADLKTCRDSSPDGFEHAIRSWDYHVQAAWYLNGLQTLAPAGRQMAYIAVESIAPYVVGVYTLEDEYVALGSKLCRQRFQRLVKAEADRVWSGYETQRLYAPEWLLKQYAEVEEGAF